MNKSKIIILFSILFILINGAVYSILKVNEEQRIQRALDSNLNKLTSYYEMLMYHQFTIAESAYKSTINKKRVIEILSKVASTSDERQKTILRDELYNLLKEKYDILKERGILQYQFVLPNNESFLRIHKPSKFGDNLTDIRYSFKYTNSTHKPSSGFEQGRTSHGFRNVFPIFDENKKYLTALELSFSSDEIQRQITEIANMHTHFLVDRDIFVEKAWSRDDLVLKYMESAENKDLLITLTSGHTKKICVDENGLRLKPILGTIEEKLQKGKKFALYFINEDKSTIISFYPIKNIKDKKVVAWIVSYENDNFIYTTLKSNIYIEIILFLILIILFYFAYRVFTQKTILDTEVKEKTKLLSQNKKDDWIKEGNNGLNIKLSEHYDTISTSNQAINYLCEYLKAGVGTLYIYNRDDDSLQLSGSYAFVKKEELSNVFKLGEGTIGQVALQRTPIELENISREYMLISAGITSEPPLNIYTFPLIYQNELYGVIEIGATHLFNDKEKKFLDLVQSVIATKLFSAIQNKKVNDLLLEAQENNTTLEKNRNELEETNSQMQEQQAQLEEANSQMQEQQAQLEEANSEMEEQQIQLKEVAKELNIQNKELKHAKEDVDKKAKELTEKNRYKSEFLANMSHELRTPLNSIILLSNMLGQNKNKTLREEDIKKAHIINSSGEELLGLINDVLDLSKVEAGKMELQVSSFNSDEFFNNIQDTFEPSALNKGLKLILNNSYHSTITTDANKLSQIVKNFISNSLKFTHVGTIELIIEPSGSKSVKLSVKDSGIGIDKDKQEFIFKAFAQADGSTSRKYGGTGLGLSITKKLVELLGGKLSLESQENIGSTFSIIIPNLEESSENISKPIEEITVVNSTSKTLIDDSEKITPDGRVFLVIEDNETFALTLKSVINNKGDYALIATTGEGGLELAQNYTNIEGILLDLGLPDIDGVEVLKRLKTDIHTRNIPVYIISGRDSENRGDIIGAAGFKQKPLSNNDLENLFDDLKKINDKEIKELLIVEDDQIQRESMMEFIAKDNLKTTGASSVREAIQEIEKNIYDGVVVDLTLMDKSGLEVCEYIKSNEIDMPIIVYTGKSLTHEEESEIKKYTDSIIIKSVNSQTRLLEEVDIFLHRVKTPIKKDTKKTSISDISFENKKIMVVDDDMRNIFVIVEILEERGAEVLTAINGKEALELLDDNRDTDVVLMDIMMPVMDGYDTIKHIRDNPVLKDISIIAVTAKSMAEDREKAMKVGADDCLSKPLNLDTFVGVLKAWIK